MFKFILVGFILIFSCRCFSQDMQEKELYIYHTSNHESLNDYLQITADSGDHYLLTDLTDKKRAIKFIDFNKVKSGFNSKYTYWGKITLVNQSERDFEWIFYIGSGSEITVYIPDEHGKIQVKKTGTYAHPNKREINDIFLSASYKVRLFLKKSEKPKTIYIKLKNEIYKPRFKLKLITPDNFYAELFYNYIAQSVFHGALWMMILYNFIMFLSTKDKAYLYYVLYMASLSSYFIIFYGFLLNYPKTEMVFAIISYLSSMVFYFMFMLFLVDGKKLMPRWSIIIQKWIKIKVILIGVLVVVLLSSFYFNLFLITYIDFIILFISFIESILFITTLIFLLKSKNILARYFVIGSGFLTLGNILSLSSFLFLNRYIKEDHFYLQFGILAELVLFSVGLGFRARLNEEEKRKAQEELIIQLKTNESLQTKVNRELSLKVEERTAEILKAKQEIELINLSLEKKVEERTEKLRNTNQKMAEINKELDLFLYRASHDLRGPIARMLGLFEAIKLENVDSIAMAYFDMFNHSALEMDKLLSQLRTVSFITNKTPELKEIPLKAFIEQIKYNLNEVIHKNKVTFESNVDEKSCLKSDPELLIFVVQNVIENSIVYNYTDNHTPVVKIYFSENEENAIIKITDNGIGIPPEYYNLIFDMFFRATSSSKGSGLGLYLVKRTLVKLQGNVQVQSRISEFTTFTITLPKNPVFKEEIGEIEV